MEKSEANATLEDHRTGEQSTAYRLLSGLETTLPAPKFEALKKHLESLYSSLMDEAEYEKGIVKEFRDLATKVTNLNIEYEKITAESYHDNSKIGDLKRELLKGQNEVTLAMERESKLAKDRDEVVRLNAELTADIDQIRQHKIDMLEPQLVAGNKELRLDILQRKQQIINLQKDLDEKRESYNEVLKEKEKIDVEKEKFSIALTKASEFPPKMMKQNEVLKEAIMSLHQETVKQEAMDMQLDAEIVKTSKKKQDTEKEKTDFQGHLESRMLDIQALESQADEIFKNHELAKEQLSIQKSERVRLDAALKRSAQEIRKEHDSLLRTFRDKENAYKTFVRLEAQVNNIHNLTPKINHQKEELERQVMLQVQQNKLMKNKMKSIRQEIDLLIYQYLQQENLETQERERIQNALLKLQKLEDRLNQAVEESQQVKQELYSASVERDLKARDLTKMQQKLRIMTEEIRIKTSNVKDCVKREAEVSSKLKHYVHLYDTVKAERNKCVNMIQAATQKAAEIREKIRILGNEIDILRQEYMTKDKELTASIHNNGAEHAVRDQLRNEVNKLSMSHDEKKLRIDQNASLLESLSNVINANESKLKELKHEYEQSVKSRNQLGIQLLERQDELCVLYERVNIQQAILKQGELAMSGKDEELRISRLGIQELKRQVELLKKNKPAQTEQIEELKLLRKQLEEERIKVQEKSRMLETPGEADRCRTVEGTDPSDEVLTKKLRRLEISISQKEELLLEKDLMLDEITKLTLRLSQQAKISQEEGVKNTQRINRDQIKLKEMNQSMMALVAELSLCQAKSIQLQNEKNTKEQILEEAKRNMSNGQAPLLEHEYEYVQMQKEKQRKREQLESHRRKLLEMNADEEIQTAAEIRPNAYILENQMPVPKPYGAFAPFKPQEPGSNIRHFRKPSIKPIQI